MHKKNFVLVLLVVVLFTLNISAGSDKSWKLVFEDNFDGPMGTFPNESKWVNEIGGAGWGNEEHQYYTKRGVSSFVDGKGNLTIKADRAASTFKMPCWYGECKYTSARIITKDRFEFTYGKVEARIKLPRGQGIWPAFWMLGENIDKVGWPMCGEIDILENLGHQPKKIHGTVHGPGYSGANGIGKSYKLKDGKSVDSDFHTYSVIWSEDKIEWFFDGKKFNSFKKSSVPKDAEWVFDKPHFLLLNVAVGGKWPGYPDDTTVFPQEMLVDYVRVYQTEGKKKK